MKKILEKIHSNLFFILSILILLVLFIVPVVNEGTLIGDDFGFHLSRLQGISEGLENHNFPVKILAGAANTYTYGSGFFYPSLFLYFPAILKLLSIPNKIVVSTFIIVAELAMFISSYISTKHITKNKRASIMVASLIATSFYFLTNVYYRFAVGEYLAMIFMPVLVAGMWDFVYNDFKNKKYIIIGMLGIVFSHTISIIIAVTFCIIFSLINIKIILKNPKNIYKMVLCAILVVLLTSVYWMPMLEQMTAQKLKYQSSTLSHTYDLDISFKDLFSNEIVNAKFSLGYMQCILFIANIVFLILNFKNIKRDTKQLFFISAFMLVIITMKSFWRIFSIFDIIQFPWRLLGIISILNSIVFGKIVIEIFDAKSLKNIAILILIATVFLSTQEMGKLLRYGDLPENYYNLPITLGGGKEYLPENSIIDEGFEIDYSKLDSPNEAINENNEKILGNKDGLNFEFENNEQDVYYRIPFFYYKGYAAKIIKENGEEEKLDVSLGEGGLVKVENANSKGKIVVWYKGTAIQKISYTITFSILVFIVAIYFYKHIKKDK